MITSAWATSQRSQKSVYRIQRRSCYIVLMFAACWLLCCLLNLFILANSAFSNSPPHISIGFAVYSLLTLLCLLPGCFIFAIIAAFRYLFQRR